MDQELQELVVRGLVGLLGLYVLVWATTLIVIACGFWFKDWGGTVLSRLKEYQHLVDINGTSKESNREEFAEQEDVQDNQSNPKFAGWRDRPTEPGGWATLDSDTKLWVVWELDDGDLDDDDWPDGVFGPIQIPKKNKKKKRKKLKARLKKLERKVREADM